MKDFFKIYVEQLRHGKDSLVEAEVSPEFLEVNEPELSFNQPLKLRLKALVADQHLVLNVSAKASCQIPCSICNEPADVELKVSNDYHEKPLSEIKTGVFDCTSLVREAILLEVPPYVECHQGRCPKRSELTPFLKKGDEPEDKEHRPFADLL
ncbi:MAG: hypothetical protein K0S07_1723 [Chlamydiales bacterium]|nr:hypothetical protein [Chlamydiales bacterium]